ncbi:MULTISPECIES: hypothetical protein [unclassified Dehalobacter]|jgi:hypothetical protein|uniref:hypothetical protein n=1 Tax=unclassified Dehalobacter TaxID=2635733 RepID=UPI000554968A|nr:MULTISPECIES: hypothetical protein [unclassified Dehalobacter]
MKNFNKILVIVLTMSFILIANISPAYASVDGSGKLYATIESTPLKSSASSSSSTVMTTGTGEALALMSTTVTNGYRYLMGRYAGGGAVYGYALSSKVTPATGAYVITDLNLYSSESESSVVCEISYNSTLNSNQVYKTYSQMHLLRVTDYADFTGYWHAYSGYVHTNFDTGNVYAYYIDLLY